MQSHTTIKVLTVAALAFAMLEPAAYAQSAKCQTVQFSPAVLDRFPRIREVCLDVITKDGQDYAVVKGDLLRISSKTARIRPKLPEPGARRRRVTSPLTRSGRLWLQGRRWTPGTSRSGRRSPSTSR